MGHWLCAPSFFEKFTVANDNKSPRPSPSQRAESHLLFNFSFFTSFLLFISYTYLAKRKRAVSRLRDRRPEDQFRSSDKSCQRKYSFSSLLISNHQKSSLSPLYQFFTSLQIVSEKSDFSMGSILYYLFFSPPYLTSANIFFLSYRQDIFSS